LVRLEGALRGHVEQEKSLQNTLITAQKLADTIKAGAEENAIQIVREAEIRSEALLQKSQARLEDIHREIDGLRLKRRDVEASLEASIQALHSTLEFVREQDARDRTERLAGFKPGLSQPQVNFG
jgi:cell division septum initiation protein DivIVA